MDSIELARNELYNMIGEYRPRSIAVASVDAILERLRRRLRVESAFTPIQAPKQICRCCGQRVA